MKGKYPSCADQFNLTFVIVYRAVAIGQHRTFVDGVSEKLFPAFDNMEAETDEHAERFYRLLCETSGFEDGPDLSDYALEHGLGKYEDLMFVKGQLFALATAGMYHLWERTLKAFIKRELRFCGLTEVSKREIENANYHKLTRWLDSVVAGFTFQVQR